MASIPPRPPWWQRLGSAVRRLFNPPGAPPSPERLGAPPAPAPPPPPEPQEYYTYEEAPSTQQRSQEEIAEELASYRATAYDNIGEDLAITDDEFAMGLLYEGWFDIGIDPDERRSAREQFFDYLGLDSYEFPWDEWKEWYEEAA